MKKSKKIFSLFLVFVLFFSLFSGDVALGKPKHPGKKKQKKTSFTRISSKDRFRRDNTFENEDERWASPASSYIYEEEGKRVMLFPIKRSKGKDLIMIHKYLLGYRPEKELYADFEGETFGGFYRGKQHNFVVFGNSNPAMDDGKPVFVVVKYDREFNKLGTLEIRDAYTKAPFNAGNCSMAEADDTLIIHTSRLRYDGHQSQITFLVNEQTMTLVNGADIGAFQKNHVSHSFHQLVLTDEKKNIFLVDHGDAYPRGIVLHKGRADAEGLSIDKQVNLFEFPGEVGANQTGLTLGNMVQGERNLLIGANHIDYTKAERFDSCSIYGKDVERRNAYVFVVNKEDPAQGKKVSLTDYEKEKKKTTYSAPKLVKVGENRFLALWNRYRKGKIRLRYCYLDEEGTLLSEVMTMKGAKLGGMDPAYIEGKVEWEYKKEWKRSMVYSLPVKEKKLTQNP